MSRKDDVPSALRNALSVLHIDQRIASSIQDFLSDCIGEESMPLMFRDLWQLYYGDDLPEAENHNKVTSEYSLESFIYLYLEAIRVNNKIQESPIFCVWSQGVNSIRLIEGNLFSYGFGNRRKQKNIVVIPVNTRFDTHISWGKEHADYPLVSAQTVHGAWLQRWEDAGHSIDELNRSIATQLETIPAKANGAYSCGTIVTADDTKATYYLLAIAEFDAESRAQSSPDMIEQAVIALLQHYDLYGQGCTMYLPLLGTGRSRAELSYVQSYELISKTMIEHCKYAQGQICIVATKDAMEEIQKEIGGTP